MSGSTREKDSASPYDAAMSFHLLDPILLLKKVKISFVIFEIRKDTLPLNMVSHTSDIKDRNTYFDLPCSL